MRGFLGLMVCLIPLFPSFTNPRVSRSKGRSGEKVGDGRWGKGKRKGADESNQGILISLSLCMRLARR